MFNQKSYQKHIEYEKNQEKRTVSYEQTFMFDTVDYWRHERMLAILKPIITAIPTASWLTVGDGRFGSDANFLIRNGAKHVHASSISDQTLKKAASDGYIKDFSAQNVEDLTFEDNAFDYVLCKEAFHHFPRPFQGLYEMARVAKKGIVLIEPLDPYVSNNLITFFSREVKNALKVLLNKKIDKNCFEQSGNYKYMVSEREIEKYAIAAEAKSIILSYLNDTFIDGVQSEKANNKSVLFKKVKRSIFKKDLLCKLKINSYAILCSVIQFSSDTEAILEAYKKERFSVNCLHLPVNPY